MSINVSIKDVARAAGVSVAAVSYTLSGKGSRYRIAPGTQDRIRVIASQLNYQPDGLAREIRVSRRSPDGSGQTVADKGRQIGLVIAVGSPASTLALIPAQEPVLSAAGFTTIFIALTPDPEVIRTRLAALLASGVSGILCCPGVFTAVSATVGDRCPVIALSPWAAELLVKPKPVIPAATPPKPAPTMVVEPAPFVTPKLTPVAAIAPIAVAPATVMSPVDAAVTEHRPPVVPEAGLVPTQVPEPVTLPEPVLVALPDATPVPPVVMPEPVSEPVSEPVVDGTSVSEPATSPVDTAVMEHRPPFVPEAEPVPTQVPEPVTLPEPVLVALPDVTPVPPVVMPEPVSEPVSEPVVDGTSVSEPATSSVDAAVTEHRPPFVPEAEPVPTQIPEPVTMPEPVLVALPDATPVQPAVMPEPVSEPVVDGTSVSEPMTSPVDTAVTEHRPPFVPEAGPVPTQVPEPVTMPEPVSEPATSPVDAAVTEPRPPLTQVSEGKEAEAEASIDTEIPNA
ncbi:MAG: LacI family DNA-binding transcriptional regulator [bacterium]